MDTLCYWLIGIIVALGAVMVIGNNRFNTKYAAIVKAAKAKGIDILSK